MFSVCEVSSVEKTNPFLQFHKYKFDTVYFSIGNNESLEVTYNICSKCMQNLEALSPYTDRQTEAKQVPRHDSVRRCFVPFRCP